MSASCDKVKEFRLNFLKLLQLSISELLYVACSEKIKAPLVLMSDPLCNFLDTKFPISNSISASKVKENQTILTVRVKDN